MTLATRAPEIYRALIEATAFGTRVIVEAFEHGRASRVEAIVACGGLPERNPLLMQIYADVTGREIAVAASDAGPRARRGDVRRRRGGPGRRRPCDDRRRVGRDGARLSETRYRPRPRASRGLRRALRASTCVCTICSAEAATT